MAHKAEIGLHRGTVKLVAHSPKWAECFSEEKELLSKTLGEKVLDLRHIGSTSIPGIVAKPILDILAAVKTLADVEAFTQDLNKVGYENKGDGGVLERRFFVKGGEAKRTHHLNFCEMNSFFWKSHLAFCDYPRRCAAVIWKSVSKASFQCGILLCGIGVIHNRKRGIRTFHT